MPHLIPSQVLQNDDIPDVEVFNDLFLPIAQKLSGRLNEHDINAVPFAFANLAASCYYDVTQVKKSVSPKLVTNNWFLQGGDGPDSTFAFVDGYGWQRVRDMMVSLTTGEDALWVIAQAQHGAWKGLVGAYAATVPSISTPMRLQYALQVDSVVVDETVTGAAIVPDPPFQQLYKVQEDATDFDWRHIQFVQDTVGINSFARPVRMMSVIPVSPGAHTVEMTSRRVPNLRGKVDEDGAGVYAEVFNRRIAVIRIKGSSAHTGSAPDPLISAWQDGDLIAEGTLGARLTALRDRINDLGTADLERGALNHEHIPTTVLYPKPVTINPPGGTVNVTSVYAGFAAATGWTTINDGAGNNLRTTGAMDFVTNTGVLVVLANVEIDTVSDGVAAENVQALGILALRIRNGAGTDTVLGETEVYLNASNPDPTTNTAMAPIHDDAPLCWVIDVATLSAANQAMSYIEVVGATWDGSGAASAVTMKTRRGTMLAFLLHGATLS